MPQLLFRDLPLLDDIQLNKYITILTDLQVTDPDLSVKTTAEQAGLHSLSRRSFPAKPDQTTSYSSLRMTTLPLFDLERFVPCKS
jgi:hypothetical protein